MTRPMKIMLAAMGAVVLVVIVATIIIVQRLDAAAQNEAYLICMEIHGYTPGGPGEIEGMLEAAEECRD